MLCVPGLSDDGTLALKDFQMAGLDHGSTHPREIEDPRIAARNARYGMVLFLVYTAIYSTYVVLSAFFPATMQATPLLGLNVALLFGFSLIVGAMVLAVVYSWLCRGTARPSETP